MSPKTPPRRHALSDEQWERLQPLRPPQKPFMGRPSKDHRTIINGMLWIMRTGVAWEDLPERYGSFKTVSSRFHRWRKAGTWDRIRAGAQNVADTRGLVEWEIHFVDSPNSVFASMLLGKKEDIGGPKLDPQDEALGRGQGGFSTKTHIRCEGKGKPVMFEFIPGEAGGSTVFEKLVQMGAIKKPSRGRPRRLPRRVAAAKATQAKGSLEASRGIGLTAPRKCSEKRRGRFDEEAYCKRNQVERLTNRLKQYRRIVTRYDKHNANYKAFLLIAAILLGNSLQRRSSKSE